MSQKEVGIFQRRRDRERKQSTRAAANLQLREHASDSAH